MTRPYLTIVTFPVDAQNIILIYCIFCFPINFIGKLCHLILAQQCEKFRYSDIAIYTKSHNIMLSKMGKKSRRQYLRF